MTRLATRLATRRAAQAFWCRRLGKPIRRRWPRRVTRIRRQTRLQLRDLRPQLRDQHSLRSDKRPKILIRRPTLGHITTFAASPPPPAPQPEQLRKSGGFFVGGEVVGLWLWFWVKRWASSCGLYVNGAANSGQQLAPEPAGGSRLLASPPNRESLAVDPSRSVCCGCGELPMLDAAAARGEPAPHSCDDCRVEYLFERVGSRLAVEGGE